MFDTFKLAKFGVIKSIFNAIFVEQTDGAETTRKITFSDFISVRLRTLNFS